VVRREVAALDPNQAVADLKTTAQLFSEGVARERFNSLLLGLLGLLAALLAGLGIYGVISYAVSERTREIGIRLALGARGRDVLGLVVGQGMRLALFGLAAGLAVSFALTRLMAGLLYGVGATDPLTFALVALVLAGVALAACLVPARRATKVDPSVALRCE
jgi:putative ABC transport system permease protein